MNQLRVCLLLVSLLLSAAVSAQSREIAGNETQIAQDGVITGRLNDANPRDVFYVDSLRGEVIRFELNATDGDLDPIMSVFDETGRMKLHRDDSGGTLGIMQDFTIERTGRYFVVVGRFGYSIGATSGPYELRMTRKGVLSERGSALRYGDSVIGTISDTGAEVFYTFQAEQGDILTISMVRSSGTLDPFLQVVDGDRYVIAENDDQDADTRNARLDDLIIEKTGAYIIVATRYDDSAGSFVLSIDEAENSGSGSSRTAPLPIRYGETQSSAITHRQFERYYTFEAEANDLITINMQRNSGDLDSYILLTDDNYQPIIEDDDSGGIDKNSRIADYRIPTGGSYRIIATRFEGNRGTTTGDFRLRLEMLDEPFAELPAGTPTLRYGTSVTGNISESNQQDVYAFYGRQGEVVSISMTRVDGNLDAFLDLMNGAQDTVASNDDGGNDQNALINNFTIPTTGMYYIRARRFSGSSGNVDTGGAYVLVLAERPN